MKESTYTIKCETSTLRALIEKTSEGFKLVSNFRFFSGNYYQNETQVFQSENLAKYSLRNLARSAGGSLEIA